MIEMMVVIEQVMSEILDLRGGQWVYRKSSGRAYPVVFIQIEPHGTTNFATVIRPNYRVEYVALNSDTELFQVTACTVGKRTGREWMLIQARDAWLADYRFLRRQAVRRAVITVANVSLL